MEALREQLRRPPRAVRAVETRCPAGHPQVIRVYPLIANEPFPTLFWLTCPRLIAELSRLEYAGAVAELEAALAADPELLERCREDHRAYIRERWAELSPEDRRRVGALGLQSAFLERGIGGLARWDRVKCLHLHYAHHLARGSTLGRLIEERYGIDPAACTGE